MPYRLFTFRICDVYFPDPTNVLMDLHGEDLLQGEILDFCPPVPDDSAVFPGKDLKSFAVVRVEGFAQPLVVPIRPDSDII